MYMVLNANVERNKEQKWLGDLETLRACLVTHIWVSLAREMQERTVWMLVCRLGPG